MWDGSKGPLELPAGIGDSLIGTASVGQEEPFSGAASAGCEFFFKFEMLGNE